MRQTKLIRFGRLQVSPLASNNACEDLTNMVAEEFNLTRSGSVYTNNISVSHTLSDG